MSSSTSRAQKEKMVTEFRSVTNAMYGTFFLIPSFDLSKQKHSVTYFFFLFFSVFEVFSRPADASRICKKSGYRLEVAFDLFYNDHLAQQNAERSMQSRSKAIAEAFEGVLNVQFNEFQDPDEPGRMDMNGLMRYLEELSLTPEDPKVLCLCHLLHSPRLGVLERADFLKYWAALLVQATTSPSPPPPIQTADEMTKFQITTLAELDRRLRSELSYFEEVYRYTFDFGRDEGQKSLALSTAIPLWELILPLAPGLDPNVFKPEYLQWWIELLRSRNKSVSRDTWNLFLDFVVQLEDRFANYDELAAWPSLIDDYVTLAREKLGSQGMDVC
ncbi:Scaffold-type E3 ligase [Puccinia graminis f. sp. tritici]|uniref:Defective in cullin neddylation protein n=1 Tax=Puccinia graminis f. sp. tritici TaxID=56615 RepID=A0A5B0LXX4_PUCGR|nr:Scaffold-type E3 ligase [Puccinia graminis f. sp. tritici]